MRLRSIDFEVAELRLGARALLVPGLRGRQASGERCGFRGDPARLPSRRISPAPTDACRRSSTRDLLPTASGAVPLTSGTGDVIT